MLSDPAYFAAPDRPRLAYRYRPGRTPTLVFLPGYGSDMEGAKARALAEWAARRGQACLRFDYAGCGLSDGAFADGTIGGWTADALALVDALVTGPILPVGSSMGGWIALLVALARPARVNALVGIAAAPDFTAWGIADTLTSAERADLDRTGHIERPSAYGPAPMRYSAALIADGAGHLLLNRAVALDCPVRLLHGQRDAEVPPALSLALAKRLRSADVQVTLVKDGDHRLSRDRDIPLLTATLEALLSRCSAD